MALEFHCSDVGLSCGHVTRADDEGDLLPAVAAHAREKHDVELNDTLVDYARSKVRAAHRQEGHG